MVELASDLFVCIVDESKLVEGLGGSKGSNLPGTTFKKYFVQAELE